MVVVGKMDHVVEFAMIGRQTEAASRHSLLMAVRNWPKLVWPTVEGHFDEVVVVVVVVEDSVEETTFYL